MEVLNFPPLNACFILLLMQVDAGHVYGDNLERQHNLRLFKDGKLKYQVRHAESALTYGTRPEHKIIISVLQLLFHQTHKIMLCLHFLFV